MLLHVVTCDVCGVELHRGSRPLRGGSSRRYCADHKPPRKKYKYKTAPTLPSLIPKKREPRLTPTYNDLAEQWATKAKQQKAQQRAKQRAQQTA